MIRTQISLDAETYAGAKAEARRRGISLAELLRRALSRELGPARAPRQRPWMRFSGAVSGGRPDDSDNASLDRMVYGSVE
jgi:hypothetical protein